MNNNAQNFKKWHLKIYQHYFNAKVHLEIWWLLHDKKYMKFLNKNKSYFTFNAYAHLTTGILEILKIFDRDSRSINIRGILRFSVDNKVDIQSEFPGCKFCNQRSVAQIENEITLLDQDLTQLRRWRNEAIAHDQLNFQNQPIKWQSFQNIIEFLERHFLDYGSTPNEFFDKPDRIISDIKNIFNDLLLPKLMKGEIRI